MVIDYRKAARPPDLGSFEFTKKSESVIVSSWIFYFLFVLK